MSDERKREYALITVKAVGPEDGRVVLHERHPDHPQTVNVKTGAKGHNEVFVSRDGKEVRVAETPRVSNLIGLGELERVNWNSKQPPAPKPKEEKP